MAADLALRLRVIVDAPQVIAVRHRREGAVERQDLEAVARQIEIADDLRPQQRHDVRADREAEAGEHLFGHRGAAEDVAALEHEHLPPGAGEIGRRCQAVVAAADDDRVILHCGIRIADCGLRLRGLTSLQAAAAGGVADHEGVQEQVRGTAFHSAGIWHIAGPLSITAPPRRPQATCRPFRP